MVFPPTLHEQPAYVCDTVRRPPEWTSQSSSTPSYESDDPYDACKDSPFVDTLVEGAVVLLIAVLINLTFWGIVLFSDDPLHSPAEVA